MNSKIASSLLLTLLIVIVSCNTPVERTQEKWIPLFNGVNLDGWNIKISGHEINNNYKNTFIVEDSILKVNYQEYDSFRNKFGHLYYEKPYSHYRLRIEYKMIGNPVPGSPVWAHANSGVMLHSQSAHEQELNQNFPVSVELQFLSELVGENRTNGNLASPGTHVWAHDSLHTNHMLYSRYVAPRQDQWIKVEAIVYGDSLLHHLVEGDTVLTYTKPRIGG